MGKRGPKPLIERLMSSGEEDNSEYIVIYDISPRPTKSFYRNLYRLEVEMLQKSVILVRSRNKALALKRLIQHYGGDVRVFKIAEEL